MTVTVGYTIHEEVIDVNDVRGGINVYVDGERVVRYQDETAFDSRYPWKPEYAGEYINTALTALIERATSLATGETDIYEVEVLKFGPTVSRLVVEPLSSSEIRVAHRVTAGSAADPPLPAIASARGHVVDRCEFCHAVSDAAHGYVREVREFPLEWGLDLLDTLETELEALDDALQTCEETPPTLH